MGTNYYALEPECPAPCKHCEQAEWHIGKNLTMFQAHETSPWGVITSWADWKRVLTNNSLQIRDEYGRTHDLEDFIRDVEATDREDRSRQYRWMVAHGHSTIRDWLDADGFSITSVEFS